MAIDIDRYGLLEFTNKKGRFLLRISTTPSPNPMANIRYIKPHTYTIQYKTYVHVCMCVYIYNQRSNPSPYWEVFLHTHHGMNISMGVDT